MKPTGFTTWQARSVSNWLWNIRSKPSKLFFAGQMSFSVFVRAIASASWFLQHQRFMAKVIRFRSKKMMICWRVQRISIVGLTLARKHWMNFWRWRIGKKLVCRLWLFDYLIRSDRAKPDNMEWSCRILSKPLWAANRWLFTATAIKRVVSGMF